MSKIIILLLFFLNTAIAVESYQLSLPNEHMPVIPSKLSMEAEDLRSKTSSSSGMTWEMELQTINPQKFLADNPSPERQALTEFFTHQIDKYLANGITQAQLDQAWNDTNLRNKSEMMRFQIIDQKLYADAANIVDHSFAPYIKFLQNILSRYKIENIDFIFHPLEGLPKDISLNIPSFMTTKNLDISVEKDRLLLPDIAMISSDWAELTNRIINSHSDYPWENKINKLFWRGSTTGGGEAVYKISNIDRLPRLKIVMLSALYPDLIDAVFTRCPRFYFEENSKLRMILDILFKGKNQKITQEAHQKYKYLISIDGNSSAWQRLPWIMLSNSVLVKQETSETQWFYSALKPYHNYVPVDEELINIFAQLEWMNQHDLELQQISQNAQNFIRNNLMPEHIEAHVALILNEYHQLHRDIKLVATLMPADEVLNMIEPTRLAKMTKTERINEWFVELERKLQNLYDRLINFID